MTVQLYNRSKQRVYSKSFKYKCAQQSVCTCTEILLFQAKCVRHNYSNTDVIGKVLQNQVGGILYLCYAVQELFTSRVVCLLVGSGCWLVSAPLLITPQELIKLQTFTADDKVTDIWQSLRNNNKILKYLEESQIMILPDILGIGYHGQCL